MPQRDWPGVRVLAELLDAGGLKIATSLLRQGYRVAEAILNLKRYFPDALTRSLEALMSRAVSANTIGRRYDRGVTGRTGPPGGIPVDPTLTKKYRFYFKATWRDPQNGRTEVRVLSINSDVWLNQEEAAEAAKSMVQWTQNLGSRTVGSPKAPSDPASIEIQFLTILQAP